MSQPRRTTPSSAAPTGNPPGPAYVPQAALASERMLGSVLSRIVGAPQPAPGRTERPGRSTAAQRVLPQSTTPRSDEAEPSSRSAQAPGPSQDEKAGAQIAREGAGSARRVEPSELLPVAATWAPPGARAGMAAEQSAEEARPLWSALPKIDLQPVLAAVEAQLSARAEESARETPLMTVLSGSAPRAQGEPVVGRSAQQAAEDASVRLMEALRAHASARALASDDRITLGDMTLIAHADSKQQLAAASQHQDHTPGQLPLAGMIELTNPKVKPDQHNIDSKLSKVAELIRKDVKLSEQMEKERFGVS